MLLHLKQAVSSSLSYQSLADFDYNLPPHLIAQEPLAQRDASRLLHVPAAAGGVKDEQFKHLPSLLRPDDVLVFNNTKVIPAQLYALKAGSDSDMAIGITLLKHERGGEWECFAKPARKLSIGDTLKFGDVLSAEVLSKTESGTVVLRFDALGESFYEKLDICGQMPLPPYIKREEAQAEDFDRYQTVFAKQQGAVAAPTAGLHFTDAILAELQAKGIEQHYVTLHVGGGTFLPVRSENIHDHQMHKEWMVLSEDTAAALNQVKQQGRRIISIGTTSLRCLESCADEAGILHPQHQETGIFITPGYRFRAVDALLTNFHLPKSTLLMLVAAFSGLDRIKTAYSHATREQYRFFSYGDACFLER